MRTGRTARDADNRSTGILVPVRGGEAGEGRYEVDSAAVRHGGSQVFYLRRRGDEAQTVAQPLHDRASDIDRALQSIVDTVADFPCNGRQQVVLRHDRLPTRVQHHEAACPVGVLDGTRLDAHLAEESRLLVAGDARDRHFVGEDGGLGVSVNLRTRLHFGHHGQRDVEQFQQVLVPFQVVDVEEHGAGSIRDIGHVYLSACQTPYQPCVNIAETELAHLGAFACSRYVVENPLDLCPAEVSIDNQPGLLMNLVRQPLCLQLVAVLGRTAVLPDNGVVDGFFGVDVPYDGRLTLVGDADAGNVKTVDVDGGDGFRYHRSL